MKLPAIPTTYGGVRFRSRLEARWAALFDALGWTWDYEPFDLHGYIPDFLITRGLDTPEPLLIECKPFVQLDQDATAVARKVDEGGWLGDALIVGSVHWPKRLHMPEPGVRFNTARDAFEPAPSRVSTPDAGWRYTIGRMRKDRIDGTTIHAGAWTDAYLERCEPLMAKVDDDDCAGYWYPTVMPSALTTAEYMFVSAAWSEAGNKTQWRAGARR